MPSRNYRDLIVWQKAMDLAMEVYRCTGLYPNAELYGLISQTRRAAVSIAANIAEGEGRGTDASFIQFLRISHGSLREVETHLILAQRLDFLPEIELPTLLDRCGEIGRMLNGLIRSKGPAA